MGQVDDVVDVAVASEYVCRMYGQGKEQDVDEARYRKLMQMSGKIDMVRFFSFLFKEQIYCLKE